MSLEVRNSAPYRAKRILKNRTVPVKAVNIGMCKAPAQEGRPGFIRIGGVHQGDPTGVRGVLHIYAVDCVIQCDVVTAVQGLT